MCGSRSSGSVPGGRTPVLIILAVVLAILVVPIVELVKLIQRKLAR